MTLIKAQPDFARQNFEIPIDYAYLAVFTALEKTALEVSSISSTANAQITTVSAHCLEVNDKVAISGTAICPGVDGVYTVQSVVDTTSFTLDLDSSTHGQSNTSGQTFAGKTRDLTGYLVQGKLFEPLSVGVFRTNNSTASGTAGDTRVLLTSDSDVSPVAQVGDTIEISLGGFFVSEVVAVGEKMPACGCGTIQAIEVADTLTQNFEKAGWRTKSSTIDDDVSGNYIEAIPITVLDLSQGQFIVEFPKKPIRNNYFYTVEIQLGSANPEIILKGEADYV